MKVGDRVDYRGHKGTVRSVQPQSVGVELDERLSYGHDLNGGCKVGHGWYFDPNDLGAV